VNPEIEIQKYDKRLKRRSQARGHHLSTFLVPVSHVNSLTIRSFFTPFLLAIITTAVLIGGAASETPVSAYANHTVGGPAGWLFDPATNRSAADYTAWATNQTFSLGDFLIFNTNTNQTVIETYNQTTFRSCSVDESESDDTFVYNGGSNQFGQTALIAVQLTYEGPGYYFSGASDGIQCLNGMGFGISVQHGLGLPDSLRQPPPPPYAEPPSSDDDGPGTTINNEPVGNGGFVIGANVRRVLCVILLVMPYFVM
jgi:hypothetical protein